MEQAGEDISLPECSADFLLHYFLEIGPTAYTGMGSVPFDFTHIVAWQCCTGVELHPWQAQLLVQMSRDYVEFAYKATEPECLSPSGEEAQIIDRRDAVFRALRTKLRGLISKPKSGKIRKRKKGA